MKTARFPLVALVAFPLILGACTDPGMLNDPNNPNRNRDSGVLLGAGVGAVLGNLIGGDTEATIAGAVVGGVAGGVIGNNLDRQEADLRRDLGNENVRINNTGESLILTLPQDILFATDSFEIRSDLQRDIRTVAGNLIAYPETTVQVVGHTDNVGDASYNLGLSQRRAAAVAGLLIDSGVRPSRVSTVGRGEDQPIASNLSPEGRALNRRVEIVILPNG